MPSADFHNLPIDSIVVNRDSRQRRELTRVEDLAESIRRRGGLINPILVRREDYSLIAGERRLAACRSLGWTSIPVQFEDETDEGELRLLELEENTKRVDLPWQEQCLAVEEYRRLAAERNPAITSQQIADALGLARSEVLEQFNVAKEVLEGNTAVANAPTYTTARGLVRRKIERLTSNELAAISGGPEPKAPDPIAVGDFREFAPAYAGPRFNFIHCDFPYGINADKRHQGYSHEGLGSYEDSPDLYWSLCAALAQNLDRLAQDSCHLMFWFSMRYYHETLNFFEARTNFVLDPFPLIWIKSDNVGLLPDPERGPRRIYETALFGSRGDRKVVRPTSNARAVGSVRSDHMSEKSQEMLEYFFGMFVDSSTSIFDPTAGSGSALRAAKTLGAASLAGLEANEEFAKRANERLR